MFKKELRVNIKEARKLLTDEDLQEKSLAIANNLIAMDIWDKHYYHLFLPITEHREVNTEFILHILHAKDKEIVISKSDFESISMTHFLLTDNTKIKKNSYNIPEPLNGLEVPTDKIEVVFVPLLAYDLKGHRVGYGKGFYDAFLKNCQPDTIKIGVSFFEPEIEIEDIYEQDITLDYCVTPNKVYQF